MEEGVSVSRVEDVTLRLAAIQEELLALPDGPSEKRYQLLVERDALREQAAEFAVDVDAERSTAELEAELLSLRRRRREIVESRSGYVMGKGGDSQGPASGAWVKLSGQSRSAAGLDHINVRISRIEDVLASRKNREPVRDRHIAAPMSSLKE